MCDYTGTLYTKAKLSNMSPVRPWKTDTPSIIYQAIRANSTNYYTASLNLRFIKISANWSIRNSMSCRCLQNHTTPCTVFDSRWLVAVVLLCNYWAPLSNDETLIDGAEQLLVKDLLKSLQSDSLRESSNSWFARYKASVLFNRLLGPIAVVLKTEFDKTS